MVRSSVLGAASLILALQTSAGANPSPAPTPKTIIQLKVSPFCQTVRDNVFHAVEGLRINDNVIEQGQGLLAKLAYDGVVDRSGRIQIEGVPPGNTKAPSVQLDEYQLGQVVGQAAHNLQRIAQLLNDSQCFAQRPQSSADRDLASMKAALQAVADAQERSLNFLSGQYETAALNDMLSRGDNTGGALGAASVAEKDLKLGDPILTSPSTLSLPAGGAQPHGSLFAGTPAGHITTALAISQRLTGDAESRVLSALMPGVDRCRGL